MRLTVTLWCYNCSCVYFIHTPLETMQPCVRAVGFRGGFGGCYLALDWFVQKIRYKNQVCFYGLLGLSRFWRGGSASDTDQKAGGAIPLAFIHVENALVRIWFLGPRWAGRGEDQPHEARPEELLFGM